MNLQTRDYKPEDSTEVNKLWNDTGMGGAERGDNNKVIEKTLQIGGKLLILENNLTGEIVGTSWLTTDGRRIYLHHFGIKPKYQGNGYSKILLKSSLDFARSTGKQIKLEVHRNLLRATELYKKAGFKYLGDYDVYIIRDYQSLNQTK